MFTTAPTNDWRSIAGGCAAERAERFYGTEPTSHSLFRDAQLLAEAIDLGFSGASPLDEALSSTRARNEAAGPIYAMTQDFGTHAPPPAAMQQLFAAPRDDQEQTTASSAPSPALCPSPSSSHRRTSPESSVSPRARVAPRLGGMFDSRRAA